MMTEKELGLGDRIFFGFLGTFFFAIGAFLLVITFPLSYRLFKDGEYLLLIAVPLFVPLGLGVLSFSLLLLSEASGRDFFTEEQFKRYGSKVTSYMPFLYGICGLYLLSLGIEAVFSQDYETSTRLVSITLGLVGVGVIGIAFTVNTAEAKDKKDYRHIFIKFSLTVLFFGLGFSLLLTGEPARMVVGAIFSFVTTPLYMWLNIQRSRYEKKRKKV